MIVITGDPDPELLSDLDGARVGKARMVALAEENLRQLNERLVNWSIVAYPNEGWARTVFGEPDVERLWDALGKAVRLDEPDPVAAWNEHMDRLVARAAALNERRFDAIHFSGPGTDLTVGLLPGSIWKAAPSRRRWGAATSRTCRPKRSTRRRTTGAPRASSARRSRSAWPERSCATSRCASRPAGSSR